MRLHRVPLAALPPGARTLFGDDFFSTLAWYETVIAAALPPDTQATFFLIEDASDIVAVLPLQQRGATLSALTTPYTCLWQPLLAAGRDAASVGLCLAALCRAHVVRLDALDLDAPDWAPLRAGLRQAGMHALPFQHFGNWVLPQATDWDAYLASRPGQLRQTLRRRTRKLLAAGAVCHVVDSDVGLEAAIAAYGAMHARSWKQPEPFPQFNPALMRRCALDGSLRLGVLSLDGQVLAAQFWVVFRGQAAVLKLAHDAAADAWSPGTVLTGLMIRHVLTQDRVTLLDFGRGDDPYKQLWMSHRRQRSGLILANPWRPAGAWAIARHATGQWVKSWRRRDGAA